MSELNGSGGTVTVQVNGERVTLPRGSMLIAALLKTGAPCRISVTGEPRTALCGMGICFECRVSIDGVPHCRSCQILCEPGMDVKTDG